MLTEVGFLRRSWSDTPTVPASFSVGTPGQPTKFADHGNLSDSTRIVVAGDDGMGIDTLQFTIHSRADVSLVGSFYYKGFIVQRGD